MTAFANIVSAISKRVGVFFAGLILVGVLLINPQPATAQIAIETLTTVTEVVGQQDFNGVASADPCTTGEIGVTNCGDDVDISFGVGDNLRLTGFTAGGADYEPASDLFPPEGLSDRLLFRRNGTPERDILFFQNNGTALNLVPGLPASSEAAMRSLIINRGIDNVFDNGGAGSITGNNIQRVDYIIDAGLSVPTNVQDDIGFLILERNGNDPIGVAAITALDGVGNPSAYGPLLSIGVGAWGGTPPAVPQFPVSVLRRDNPGVNDPPFRPSHTVGAQSIQGIFFPISSFLVGLQPVFGYSIFAADVGAGDDLVEFQDFPQDTSGTGAGGLDLIAGGAAFTRRDLETTTISGQLEDLGCEPPLNLGGITVQLLDDADVVIFEVQTNANGEYLFDNVLVNQDYTVRIDPNAPIPDTCRTQDQGIEVSVGTQPVTNVDFAFRSPAFSLLKRITDYVGGNDLPDFTQVIGNDPDVAALENLGLGQGVTDLSNIDAETGNTIEYTIYYINTLADQVTSVELCDRIPSGTTYAPGTIQTRGPGNPVDPAITDINDADGFIAPGAALPAACGPGPNERGAVVVDIGTVESDEAGFIRFRVTVD